MKKFYLLTKTLLIAALLMVGASNAWAADTFLTTWTGQVGTATNEGNFKYATKKVNIAAGETYVYTLTNFNDGNNSNYWKNWVVEGNLGDKYFDCEARGNQWNAGDGPTPSYSPVMAYTDVENFQTAYNGANVTITISRNAAGNQFTVTHTSNVLGTTAGNTEKYYGGTWTVAVGAEEDWDIYITEEEAHFVVTSVTYTDAESNVTNYNPIYQRGYTTAWSAGDIAEGKWVQTNSNGAASINATKGLYIASTKDSGHTNSYEITNSSQISPSVNSTLFIDAIWNIGSAYGTNNYNYLKIGSDIEIKCCGQDQVGYVVLNGTSNKITDACVKNYKRDNDIWNIHIEINTATNTVTNLTIKGLSATYGVITKQASISLSNQSLSGSATYNTIAMGNTQAAKNYSQDMGLVSFMVSEKPADVTYANYTVHFQDNNGAKVKEDEVRNGEVGAAVSANAGDMASFIADGNKYVYSSDGGGTTVANDGSAEFTVTYTKYVSTSYTVKAQVSGADLTTLASGTAYLDGSTTEYWSKYINVEDKWYVADETTYGTAITTATKNVAFTATDAIDYFFEFEDMTISSTYNSAAGESYSNGSAKTLNSSGANAKTTSTIAAGVYTISMYGKKWDDKNDNYRVSYSTDGTNWIYLGDISYGNSEEGLKSLSNAIIPAASYIKFETTLGVQVPRRYMDYITFAKTADIPTTENIVVTSAGYATYVSNYNLDFTSATTKAYKVSVAEKGVATMTLVDEVPAKTPVLLYVAGGNGDGEAIPVTTDVVSAVSGNNLIAGTGAAVATTVGDYTNMILNNIDDKVGFYYAAGQTVAANRAYLHFDSSLKPDELTARGMILEFADDILTGISEAAATAEAAQKEGKFVVDGKLVIFKKGMKFNANGARIY